MSDDLKLFSSPELKDTVRDMRDLLSQSRFAFLLGAGCSLKAGLPLMPKLTEEVLGHDKIGEKTKELLNEDGTLGTLYTSYTNGAKSSIKADVDSIFQATAL